MEREALAVQQGSFSFAICLLVLGLGINDPTWAQDEPVEPPAEQATEKKSNKASAGRSSIATLDKVHLSDGSIQYGKVAERGGNTISLEYRGAAKRIPKALVDKIVFYEGRRSQQKLDTDLVILKVNEHRVPCKILKESGVEVRVELANGAKTTYRRDRVLRLHYRNQVLNASSDYYTVELAQEMDQAIRLIVNGEESRSAQAEKFLVQCGVFALGKVQKSLGSFKDAGEPEKKKIQSSFARILHIHQLKKVVTDSMETSEPRIYEELTYGGLETRESLLKVLYPKFTDESVPLAKYIISNEQEDVRLRALSVEILRRLNCNKALLEIYNDSSRELKLVSSVALVRNRIFFPVPTLLEALDVGGEQS